MSITTKFIVGQTLDSKLAERKDKGLNYLEVHFDPFKSEDTVQVHIVGSTWESDALILSIKDIRSLGEQLGVIR